MNEVYEYLKTNPTFYIATMDGDQPRVRPFGAVAVYEGKLYLVTANWKKVFAQMMKNPKVEICTMGKDGTWIRITATVVQDDRMDARQHMLDENPMLKNMYAADDGKCEVVYLKDATAIISSFNSEPKAIKF